MYTNTGGVMGPGSSAPQDRESIELLIPEDVLGIGTGSDILIVDDSDLNLVAYEAALAPLGRRVVLARSGTEALKELLDADFALVLLDFSMPGISGIETARMVRSRPRSKGTPILFISGASPSSHAVLEAFSIGALDFISKPVLPEVLRAKVAVYLQLQERTLRVLQQAAALRDAHQRLEHVASAELANKRKDEFLAMLGHELRNPLAAIAAAVELVRMRGVGLERETSVLQRQVTHLTQIVDDLLDVSRITRGVVMLRRESVDVRDAVSQALEMLHPESTRLGHEVSIDVPPNVLVDADRNRLVQVIFNLVFNAVTYTPAPGRISITAQPTIDFVTITVSDNGRGISRTLLADMFELFVQGDRELDRKLGGLGIGLTLARTIVHLHGGSIAVSSEGEGKGASFTVQWPRSSRSTRPRELPASATTQAAGKPLRVLVVDDDVDAGDTLAMVVEVMGHAVAVAHDGDAAIASAEKFAPDVVLLDIGLQGADGFELAAQLRALASCHSAVLVAVTGYGSPEDIVKSLSAGFADHIVKPVKLERLRSVFRNISPGT